MPILTHNQKALLLLVVVLFAVGSIWLLTRTQTPEETPVVEPEVITEPEVVATSTQSQIGTSVESRAIEAYSFGTGDTHLLFVGGIHGGYEWNTVDLAIAMIDEFQTTPELIPENITVHIIPNLNPDGYARHLDPVTNYTDAAKRFNANSIDLNRNFACKWAPESSWRSQTVSAGAEVFSEPEAAALRDYVAQVNPQAAIFWHSTGNAVFTSECGAGVLPATETLMNAYATAANYEAAGLWTAYPITGDAEGWLASLGIPAVTVELETRDSIEWSRNIAGVKAVLELYRK